MYTSSGVSGKRSCLFPFLPAFIGAAATLAGSFLSAFIFTCGMKYMDGPAGGQKESLPMMMLFACVPPMLTALVWSSLHRKKAWFTYSMAEWPAALGVICYFILAAVVGFAMRVVQWNDNYVHLDGVAAGALAAAAFVAIGLGLYYLMRGPRIE